MRLFVALELPEPVREALAAWAGEVASEIGCGLRVVRPESLHVTLCFLGSLPDEQAQPAGRACEVVRGLAVGELSPFRALWLPRRRPGVLAVGLDDPQGRLATAQADVATALAAIGAFQMEARSFLPHVTVARVTRGARVRAVDLPPPPPVTFAAECIALYRSHLGQGPARYECLHRVRLSRR